MDNNLGAYLADTIEKLTAWASVTDDEPEHDKVFAEEQAIIAMEELLLFAKNPGHYEEFDGSPPQPHRLERPNSVPLAFDGWVLAHVDSRDRMSEAQLTYRDRWSEVTVYRTTTGRWVVAQYGRTREKDRALRGVVRACETSSDVLDALKFREKRLTTLTREALTLAIAADPDLADMEENI